MDETVAEQCPVPQLPSEARDEVQEEALDKELSDSILENGKRSSNDSEYESIDSADSSGDERAKTHERRLENEIDEHGSESEGSVILEREEGDGQESIPAKKVDDDEDKKNPQYIPKRGTFYEHDDRTLDDSEKQENQEKNDKQNKKNVWMEKKERWSHDRYNDSEQAPKSRAELVAIYGYDIRNEDGPPRARRRRRYGRGPNKYTRTWEDEEAYKPAKPVKSALKKPKKKGEDYPPLPNQEKQSEDECENENFENQTEERPHIQNSKFSSTPSDNHMSANDTAKTNQDSLAKKAFNGTPLDQSNNRQQQRPGTGRIMKPKSEGAKEIKDSDYKGFTKTRQFRNSKSEQKILPKPQKKDKNVINQVQSNKQNSSIHEMERDLNKMNIQDSTPKNSGKPNNQRQTSVPPRLQGEQKGSKRYSSLRQRSLPETAAPPFNQANYYPNDYSQPTQTPQQQQGLLPTPSAIHAATPQVPQIAPPPLTIPQQVPVTATPILQAPPQFAAPFPQAPPAFLQTTVPPPPFLSQQPPPLINYVQGQQFAQPAPFQGFQPQQFNTVNQPAELYQCQGGTTYYSTQNQHVAQRTVPQKRPKAAIPIVPPPPQEPRGRGRTSTHRETPPAGEEPSESSLMENNSNFEDAVVVVQQ